MNIFYYKERKDQYPELRKNPLSPNLLGYILRKYSRNWMMKNLTTRC